MLCNHRSLGLGLFVSLFLNALVGVIAVPTSFGQTAPSIPAVTTIPDAWMQKIKWRCIGPANMSGRITAITVFEKDPSIWWAASASGGLVKTINNGMSFEHQFDHQATVSIGSQGQEIFPYDLVYVDGAEQVWTVVDRRAPGTVALPPPQAVIDSASQNWTLFTSSLAIDNAAGVAAVVSEGTRQLAGQVAGAASGPGDEASAAEPLSDPELFSVLVARARAASAQRPDDALMAFLDSDQRRALVTGQLGTWTQVDPNRVVASLIVDGQRTATVPFVATAEGWAFDMVGALQASKGGSR